MRETPQGADQADKEEQRTPLAQGQLCCKPISTGRPPPGWLIRHFPGADQESGGSLNQAAWAYPVQEGAPRYVIAWRTRITGVELSIPAQAGDDGRRLLACPTSRPQRHGHRT
jgi:hypothetical protein